MQSISKKLVEDDKNLQEEIKDCKICYKISGRCMGHFAELRYMRGKVTQHAETCEAILKSEIVTEIGLPTELYNWLETEIKILKEGKLV